MRGSGEALAEMQSAIEDMRSAQGALEKQLRADALPPSENALAHLYKVLKLMPELEDLPTDPEKLQQQPRTNQPPALTVVLDAMKKKRQEDPENKELAEALEEAERLRDEQASVNIGVQSSGEGQGSGESELVRASGEGKAGEGKSQAKAKSENAKGQNANGKAAKTAKKPKSGEPQKGEGKGGQSEQDMASKGEPKENEAQELEELKELAEKESELSKEAAALAEKLGRLAGKDSRLGHNAGNKMGEAAKNMGAAARAMAQGNGQTAGIKGAESGAALNEVVGMIERALSGRPERVDVSQEEAPKEYEMLVAEYLKRLSYEE
jgi:hypothetical protein